MRKLLLILAAVAALAVAAVPTATPKSHAPQLKVALIAPSAHNDLAFTQSMHHALLNLQKKFNFQLSVSENQFVVANAANIMHQYAQDGYDLIIAHGSQYGATVQQLAPQFPKTTFAGEPPARRTACRMSTRTRPPPSRAGTSTASSPRS